ncbi:PAAR domain-containing protein [Rhodopseudomonas sp. NSM]|uniref:PAAR domain-containing protein n=1 Tax=Rhodopseudomonas sp. NSM TaxID=3457630 RepID=UPI0040361FDC
MSRTLLRIALLVVTGPALAQTPSAVTGGSTNVTVSGKPAARAGDTTSDGAIVEGSTNVFINGKPAAVVGGRTNCGGVVVDGGGNVFINGKPMARAGDSTAGCPK